MEQSKMIRCIVTGAAPGSFEHIPTIEVNGMKASFQIDTEITLPEWAVEALDLSSGYDVKCLGGEESVSPPVIPADGDGEGADASPGGASVGTTTFNPEVIIEGKLDDVKAKLVGLTAEQLDLVAAAEIDREAPRKGVAAMIEEAKAALAGGE